MKTGLKIQYTKNIIATVIFEGQDYVVILTDRGHKYVVSKSGIDWNKQVIK